MQQLTCFIRPQNTFVVIKRLPTACCGGGSNPAVTKACPFPGLDVIDHESWKACAEDSDYVGVNNEDSEEVEAEVLPLFLFCPLTGHARVGFGLALFTAMPLWWPERQMAFACFCCCCRRTMRSMISFS